MRPLILLLLSLFISFSSTTFAAVQWVGTAAPAITLPDQDNQPRSLSDYKGQWLILYFYPKDGTPGCTTEASQFRDYWPQFQQKKIAVLGVSIDSVASHKKFSQDLHLPFPLLADTERQLSKAMGLLRGFGPIAFASRQTFLIDPNGTVVYHYNSVDSSHHAEQVLADVQRLNKPSP